MPDIIVTRDVIVTTHRPGYQYVQFSPCVYCNWQKSATEVTGPMGSTRPGDMHHPRTYGLWLWSALLPGSLSFCTLVGGNELRYEATSEYEVLWTHTVAVNKFKRSRDLKRQLTSTDSCPMPNSCGHDKGAVAETTGASKAAWNYGSNCLQQMPSPEWF